jgi:ankyrin repeat protein
LDKFGADIAQSAVANGRHEVVDLLIKQGVDFAQPPVKVLDDPDYRKTTYSLQAAISGDVKTLSNLLKVGGSL